MKSAQEILDEECSKVITNPVQHERWLIVKEYVREIIEAEEGLKKCLCYEMSGPG